MAVGGADRACADGGLGTSGAVRGDERDVHLDGAQCGQWDALAECDDEWSDAGWNDAGGADAQFGGRGDVERLPGGGQWRRDRQSGGAIPAIPVEFHGDERRLAIGQWRERLLRERWDADADSDEYTDEYTDGDAGADEHADQYADEHAGSDEHADGDGDGDAGTDEHAERAGAVRPERRAVQPGGVK
jgi:hypothetical protein